MRFGEWIWENILGIVVISCAVTVLGFLIISLSKFTVEKDRKDKIEFAKQNEFFNGQHKLKCLTSNSGISGKIDGSFCFLGGNVSSSIASTENVKFIWINEDTKQLLPTVLPSNKVRFILLDETDETPPYVEFVWFNTSDYCCFPKEWDDKICNAYIYIHDSQIDNSISFRFDSSVEK